MNTDDDPCMLDAISAIVRAASPLTQTTLLRQLGRHLLALHRTYEGFEIPDPEDESYVSSCEQHPWVDFQLIEACPNHPLLDSPDYDKYDVLLEAWPDGFDEVIFSNGHYDGSYAEAIAKAVVAQAREKTIPLNTDAACTDEELIKIMRDDFVPFIRRWRAHVLKLVT